MLRKVKITVAAMLAVAMLGSSHAYVEAETPVIQKTHTPITTIEETVEEEISEDIEPESEPVFYFDGIGFIPGETLGGDIYRDGYEFVPNGYYYEKDGVRLNLVTNEPLIDVSMGLADNDLVYAIGIDVENVKYIPESTIPFGDTLDDLVSLYGEPMVQSEYGKYQYLRYEFDGYSIDLKIHVKKGLIQYTYNAVPVIYG